MHTSMEPEPEITAALKPESEIKPVVIPPPDLPRPSAQPPLLPPASPQGAEDTVKVKIRNPQEAGDEGSLVAGQASFISRVTAAVIDMVVASGIAIGLAFILPGFADRLAWLAAIAYLVTRDSLPFLGGQSVGKKAMKLRAVTVDGQSLVGNWEAALIRNGVLAIPLFAFVELFILLTREDKPERGLRLGDEWAKTKVIIEETRPSVDSA